MTEQQPTEEKVEVKIHGNSLKIHINGLLHLSLKLDDLIGMQSYLLGSQYFQIDFEMKHKIIGCKYTKKAIWIKILKDLDTLDLFPVI